MIIYTSTDINEIKEILHLQLGRNTNFPEEELFFLREPTIRFSAVELSMKDGAEVQRLRRLVFNPYVAITCSSERVGESIIRKLAQLNYFVASLNGQRVQQHYGQARVVAREA